MIIDKHGLASQEKILEPQSQPEVGKYHVSAPIVDQFKELGPQKTEKDNYGTVNLCLSGLLLHECWAEHSRESEKDRKILSKHVFL